MLHLDGIACQDHDQVFAVILDPLHQCVDRLQTKSIVFATIQAVCFIDKEHTADCRSDDLIGERCGMSHIAAHQICTGYLYQLSAGQHTDRLEILADDTRDRRFAGTRIAGKDHMLVHAAGL